MFTQTCAFVTKQHNWYQSMGSDALQLVR